MTIYGYGAMRFCIMWLKNILLAAMAIYAPLLLTYIVMEILDGGNFLSSVQEFLSQIWWCHLPAMTAMVIFIFMAVPFTAAKASLQLFSLLVGVSLLISLVGMWGLLNVQASFFLYVIYSILCASFSGAVYYLFGKSSVLN